MVGRPLMSVPKKIRGAELAAGAPRLPKRHTGQRVSATKAEREAEQQLTEHAETAYKRISADWNASRPTKAGAGATQGHASQKPSRGTAARQAQAPRPAL